MAKTERKLTCAYLYTDGTLVELYDESRNFVPLGESVDITRGYCQVYMSRYRSEGEADGYRAKERVERGRIVIHRIGCNNRNGFLAMARGGRVEATMPSVHEGSESSREKNIAVQYLHLVAKNGMEFSWCDATSVLSSQFTLQDSPEVWHGTEEFRVGSKWGYNARVMNVRDLRAKPALTKPDADRAIGETEAEEVV